MGVDLSLRKIEYFVAAAEAGSMTEAAQRLRVSQSSVSLALTDLERQLDVQLLLRVPARGVVLTEAGRTLLALARTLLECAEDVVHGVSEVGHVASGRLTVGCFTTIAPFALPRLLQGFAAEQPRIELDFVEGSAEYLQDLLREGRCEAAILYDVDLRPDVEADTLRSVSPHVLLHPGHPASQRRGVRWADLHESPMILLDVPPSAQYFVGLFESAGLKPNIRYRTSSFETVRSLVGRGFGFSMLIQRPEVDRSFEGRPLVVRPLTESVPVLDLVLARPKGIRSTRRAELFAEHCRRALR